MKKKHVMVLVLAAILSPAAVLAPAGGAAAQPEPTMVITPSSGPCDATVEVKGSGFRLPREPHHTLRLYLLQPGTTDVSMEILNPGDVDRDGTLSAWAPLYERGCEAAALDSGAEQPTGYLFIVASSTSEATGVRAGERIPNIIAVARYAYTTTTPRIHTEKLNIWPTSGPCDAAVEVSGSGFQPGQDIRLRLTRAATDETLGPLASAVADADGRFAVRFTLGELGCHVAQWNMQFGDPARPQLGIAAYPAVYLTPVPRGIPPGLAGVAYTFTTTEVTGGATPRALPSTGDGPSEPAVPLARLSFIGILAGLGVILLVALLYHTRQRS